MGKPKPDLSEFRALGERRAPCRFPQAVANLSPTDRTALEAAMGEGSISSGVIEKWFAKRGVTLGCKSITRHRNGGCGCG